MPTPLPPDLSARPDRLRGLLPLALILLSVVGVGAGLRALLLLEKTVTPSWADVQGWLLDLGFGGLMALGVLMLRQQVGRPVAWGVGLVWIGLNFASYEFVSTFESLESLGHTAYIKDPTFFLGSFTQVAHPVALALTASACSAGVWWPGRHKRVGVKSGGAALALALGCLGAGLLVPKPAQVQPWRVGHFVPANIVVGTRGAGVNKVGRISPEIRALHRADLSGRPRFQGTLDTTHTPNILLVLIEGISGAYLPTVASAQGLSLPHAAHMPQLDALARENVVYTNVVHQQRQTNRGEYAMLCGDHPKLDASVAKMSEFSRSERVCVPEVLKRGGYQTLYLQAAPLAFMLKDQFMRKAGFDLMRGPEAFDTSYFSNGWGVDDLTLYESSLEALRGAATLGKPWFATLMTVTTHHPYETPDDFLPPGPITHPHQRALAYADMALGKLMAGLKAEGLLKNTVVIVASDESAGLMYGPVPNQTLKTMASNWGFAVVVSPEGTRAEVAQPHVISDLGISLVDVAGLGKGAPHLVGRSMFRRYDTERTLHHADLYSNTQGMYSPPEGLILCEIGTLEHCRGVEHEKDRLFAFTGARFTPSLQQIEWMRQMLYTTAQEAQEGALTRLPFEGTRPLLEPKTVKIPTAREHQLVFGGQFLALPPGTLAQMDLEVEVEADGTVDFKHLVLDEGREIPGAAVLPVLSGGDRFRLKTELYFKDGAKGFRYHFAARKLSATQAILHLKRATLTLSAPSTPRPPWRQVIEEIWRAPDASPQVYSLAHSLHFKFRPTCSGRHERTGLFTVHSCDSPYLLFGPFVPAPKGARVTFSVTANAARQPTQIHLDIASSGGGIVHAKGPVTSVKPGQPVTLVVEAELAQMTPRLEARVVRAQGASAASVRGLEIRAAVLSVELLGSKARP